MTIAAAQAAASSLRDALQDYGVRTSIELQPGVGPKADPWGPAPFVRNLAHHIASYPPGTPGLAVVKGGRKGASPLQGPLANCYGGFDLVARIITMGWANHPGAGGPWSVPGWATVPRDNGRPYILGWEFEGGYLPYTDEMHDFMSRCGAASLDWLGTHNRREPAPVECHDEHKGWAPGRKPDRKDYTTASGRARIAAVRGTRNPAKEEDDMGIAIINLKPLEETVIVRPPGVKDIQIWGAIDQQRRGTWTAAQQQVRAAQRFGKEWRPLVDSGNKEDPFQFWMPAGDGAATPLGMAADADRVVIRNLHPDWTVGLTVVTR